MTTKPRGKSWIIARLLQRKYHSPYELHKEFAISIDEAQQILDFAPSAYGPGGKGEEWFAKKIEAIFNRYASSRTVRRTRSRDNPGKLKVGDTVYDKSDPNVVGTITRLEYDTVEGPEGRALLTLSKTHRSASVLKETGPIASEFRGRGSLLSVATRMLKKLPKTAPTRLRDPVLKKLSAPVLNFLHAYSSGEPRRELDRLWRKLTPTQKFAAKKAINPDYFE